jgi:ribosome maturation factor RimP
LEGLLGVSEAFDVAVESLLTNEQMKNVEVVIKAARREGGSTALRLMIDRPDGVDLELCEFIAKSINTALCDIPDLYTLEVESAGLDRPLVREADYERFRGRNVCIRTHKLWEGAKTHRGKLEGLRGDFVILIGERGETTVPYAGIKQANLEYDLREALRASEKREQR